MHANSLDSARVLDPFNMVGDVGVHTGHCRLAVTKREGGTSH